MEYLILFIIAFGCGILSTFLIRKIAVRFNIVNHPNKIIATHIKPVAYLGGAGIFLAILICLIIAKSLYPPLLSVPVTFPLGGTVWGALGFLIFGVLDDLKTFRPSVKLIAQSALAIISVASGVYINVTDIFMLDLLLSAGYIIVVVNAVNVTDVCDGLAGGLCAIVFLITSIFVPALSIPAMMVGGTIIGFLVFNFPPATIYLGDAGAHFLGFLLAVLCMQGYKLSGEWVQSFSWLILVPGVFLFEMIFLIVVRSKKGLAWWKGSPDHFSLRLQAAGLSRRQTDFIAWIIGSALVILTCTISHFARNIQLLLFAVLLVCVTVCWRFLLKHEVKKR